MLKFYQPIKKLILPLICSLSLSINAATAQVDSGILDSPRAETESSKPSEEKRDDKTGSLDFLKGYITVYLLWKNTKHIVFFWDSTIFLCLS